MRQTVTAILISNEDEFILQKRDDKPGIASPGRVANFGGTIESGEDPIIAIIRELKEELELFVEQESIKLFDTRQRLDYFGKNRLAHTFLIKNIDKTNLVLHEGEHIVYMPINSDLDKYKLSKGTKLMLGLYKEKMKKHNMV